MTKIAQLVEDALYDTISPLTVEEECPALHVERAYHCGRRSGQEIFERINTILNAPGGKPHLCTETKPNGLQESISSNVMGTALKWVASHAESNSEITGLNIPATVTHGILQTLKASLRLKSFEIHTFDEISKFIAHTYNSLDPVDIFNHLLRRVEDEDTDGEYILQELMVFGVILCFLAELQTLDTCKLFLVWITERAMACSLDRHAQWGALADKKTSYVYHQAAEWILKAGEDIAATCHFGADLREVYYELIGGRPDLRRDGYPSHNNFTPSRWDKWKTVFQEIIAKYICHVQSEEHNTYMDEVYAYTLRYNQEHDLATALERCQEALARMDVLDTQRESVRKSTTNLLGACMTGSEAEKWNAANNIGILFGERSEDSLLSRGVVQPHTLRWISHVAYIWLGIVESLCNWEPPGATDADRKLRLVVSLEGANGVLLGLVREHILTSQTAKETKRILIGGIYTMTVQVMERDVEPGTNDRRLKCISDLQDGIEQLYGPAAGPSLPRLMVFSVPRAQRNVVCWLPA